MKLIRKITLFVFTGATLFVSQAMAHNSDNQCSAQFSSDMRMQDNIMRVTVDSGEVISISGDGQVTLNNTAVSLKQKNVELASNYYREVEKSIHMFASIAKDTLTITSTTLQELFKGFLGENSKVPKLVDEQLTLIQSQIDKHLSIEGDTISFDSEYFDNELNTNAQLEQDIEDLTSKVLKQATSEAFTLMGKAMLSDGGSLDEFTARMNNMGSELESKIDAISKDVEVKGKDLCTQFKKIDALETSLQAIPSLQKLDIITM